VIVTEQRLEIQLAIPVSGNFRLTFKDSDGRGTSEILKRADMPPDPAGQVLREGAFQVRHVAHPQGCPEILRAYAVMRQRPLLSRTRFIL
jgi:hypothetical protein